MRRKTAMTRATSKKIGPSVKMTVFVTVSIELTLRFTTRVTFPVLRRRWKARLGCCRCAEMYATTGRTGTIAMPCTRLMQQPALRCELVDGKLVGQRRQQDDDL